MNYWQTIKNAAKKACIQLKLAFIPSTNNDYRPKFLQSKILFFGVFGLLCLRIITLGVYLPLPQNVFFADITKVDLLNLLNQERASTGLKALADNSKLDQAAMQKAQNMVADDYFSHTSPSGITPWYWFRQVGYNYEYAGENLAVGFTDSSQVFSAWLASPSHKANIVNPHYQDVGTAIVSGFGSNDATVVVQIFGNLQGINQTAQNITPASATINVPSVNNQTTSAPATQPKVLGQSTQAPAKNTAYATFINFMVYDYQSIITGISYWLLLLVSAALLINIVVNFNVQRGRLIAKSLVMIALLALVIFLNNNVLLQIIPYHILI